MERLAQLAEAVNRCIIRRTQALLSKYLPVKYELVVVCALTQLQKNIYESFISSDTIRRSLKGDLHVEYWYFVILWDTFWTGQDGVKMSSSSLAAITSLKKLVNHPDLILDQCRERKEGFENALAFYPEGHDGEKGRLKPGLSGKLSVLDCLLAAVKATTQDKVVLVSNYTQTLDLFERLCNLRNYGWVLSLQHFMHHRFHSK